MNTLRSEKEGLIMTQYNVLVTSIGGDLGQAVCKALRYAGYPIKIFGTDCKNFIPYPLFCDNFKVIPKANISAYIEFINKFVLLNSIDLIYICSEQELFYISDHFEDIAPEIRCRIAIQSPAIINICKNKLKTIQFLKDNKFPYVHSSVFDNSIPLDVLLKDYNYPLVVKKFTDSGSKHFHLITSRKELNSITDLDNTYMLQEYIPGIEYTNAVYKDPFSNEIFVITLERTLKDGISAEVKVVFHKEIEELCKEVAKKLNLTGSINIQLRKQAGCKPVIFEINPRYSSTSFMRANFGFNDVIYAFQNIVLKKPASAPTIKAGAAYRYITEYYNFY